MRRFVLAATTATALVAAVTASPAVAGAPQRTLQAARAAQGCHLAHGIRHVIQVDFDNVHLTRDDPHVASDLEQMPALLHFIKRQGVLMTNTHDDLVHTGTNMISAMTGLYPDRDAITQSNSGYYFAPDGTTHPDSSFAYWTGRVYDYSGGTTDQRYNLDFLPSRTRPAPSVSRNVPAPWVPFTRAGCNVGEVGSPNTVLENTSVDVANVFGANSPQAAEAKADPTKAQADLVGLAVHCAHGARLCASGEKDVLPDEPGGYTGYKALFGGAQIQPEISPQGPVRSTDGQVITDSHGNPGFPGFDSETANNSLGYAATMLEHGVQNVNVYISDAHSDHSAAHEGDLGPGEQAYEAQLHAYNAAFRTFFARLAQHGITAKNTLFTFTTDEGDHFAGTAPQPAGCTGLPGNYCTYANRAEVSLNLPGLLATQRHNTTPFAIHNDPAPALWVNGNPRRTAATTRTLDRDLTALTFTNPYTHEVEPVAYDIADAVEQRILHFVSADPARTPTLTLFSGEDSYVTGGSPNCSSPCVSTSGTGYAWNHGSYWPDMQDIWAGYVGPGISARGTSSRYTDQVDMRPTVDTVTGLHDSYTVDGVPLASIMGSSSLGTWARHHRRALRQLSAAYKQLTAPTGLYARRTLTISTRALRSDTPGDRRYLRLERELRQSGATRDALAQRIERQILTVTEGRGTGDLTLDRRLQRQAEALTAHPIG